MLALATLCACDPMKRQVSYVVTSRANAVDIITTNAYGETEQRLVKPPWRLMFKAVSHSVLSVSAQAMGPRGGVTCAIIVDGVKLQSAASTGQGSTASCSVETP